MCGQQRRDHPPPGFCATVFADNMGHIRQMVVAPNGVLYVNTWSGRYYRNDVPPAGGFLIALRDSTGSSRADRVTRFGPAADSGNAGGTGIALDKEALFAETNDRIVRYALPPNAMVPNGSPEVIVSGLPLTGDHPSRSPSTVGVGPVLRQMRTSGVRLPRRRPTLMTRSRP
jgi:glucose/arabinose dehydrogenase